MYATSQKVIIIFIITCSSLILLLSIFIVIFVRRYRQKQYVFLTELELLKSTHENAILQSSVEIQEQTFQNIAKEIHDNIGQKLALAKLQLITLQKNSFAVLEDPILLIANTIADLSDLSRTMSADIILANGFVQAVKLEVEQLHKTGVFKLDFKAEGEIIFLEGRRELILFRIIQEALQNIIKHAAASLVSISLLYDDKKLTIIISDNGNGFYPDVKNGQGLKNMKARTEILGGNFHLESILNTGTTLKILIPIYGNETAL